MGTGKPQLIVAPLQGRGTKGPNWGEGQGARILVYTVPANPVNDPWKFEVADDTLHSTHNLQLIDFDGDGRDEIVIAGWEGVFVLKRDSAGHWSKTQIGVGDQKSSPFKGSSEVKLGKLADGRRYIATIEPWHGHQVVIYTPPTQGSGLWDRTVIDSPVQWGHAVGAPISMATAIKSSSSVSATRPGTRTARRPAPACSSTTRSPDRVQRP